MHVLRCGMIIGLTLTVGGCGKELDPNEALLKPVSGTVTLDGQPLARAKISFIPTGDTKGQGGEGVTGENGTYKLTTYRGGTGAVPGNYKVIISKRLMPDGSEVPLDDKTPPIESPAREILPPTYSNQQTSKLTATVPATGGTVDFPLTKSGR